MKHPRIFNKQCEEQSDRNTGSRKTQMGKLEPKFEVSYEIVVTGITKEFFPGYDAIDF